MYEYLSPSFSSLSVCVCVCVCVCAFVCFIYICHADNLKFFNERKTWFDAQDFCQDQDSTLVHITSQTVQDHVTQLLTNQEIWEGVWIGLEQRDGVWVWTGGLEVEEYEYEQWHCCFPRNSAFHCGLLVLHSGEPEWLDTLCDVKIPFICQDLNH